MRGHLNQMDPVRANDELARRRMADRDDRIFELKEERRRRNSRQDHL